MSQSNIFQDYSIVPWYNNAEWEKVYNLIYDVTSTPKNKKTALDILIIWQQRMPLLPSGVEGTLCILEALLADEAIISERQFQTLGASSIMRFLNICVASRAQVNNFTQTAKEHGIPDWIITIRHDFAHSQRLPTVTLVKFALQECFQWLKSTYWEAEQQVMTRKRIAKSKIKLVNNGKKRKLNFEECTVSIDSLVGLYCYMFVFDALEMCYDELIQEQLEVLEAYGIKKDYQNGILILIEQGVQKMSPSEWKKCLLGMMYSAFYIVDPESLKDKHGNCNTKNGMSRLMNLLEKHNIIANIVQELYFVITDNTEIETRRLGAAVWINEILKAMLAFRMKFNKSTNEKIKSCIQFNQLNNETLKSMNQCMKCMLRSEVPEVYQKHYISNYMQLWEDTAETNTLIKALSKVPNTDSHDIDLDDFCKMQTKEKEYKQMINMHITSPNLEENHAQHVQIEEIEQKSNLRTDKEVVLGCWTLVKDTSMFESCAIGVLPDQWRQVINGYKEYDHDLYH